MAAANPVSSMDLDSGSAAAAVARASGACAPPTQQLGRTYEETAAAAGAVDCGQPAAGGAAPGTGSATLASSQQARAAAAAKELEDFELLYGLDDDLDADTTAVHGKSQQQQQWKRSQELQQLGALLPDSFQQQQQGMQHRLPVHKRQRTASPVDAAAAEAQALQQPAVAVPEAGLAGGRSEVYHLVLEVHQEVTDMTLRCFNPYKVCIDSAL